jgi:putative DNA primase/helicase
MKNELEELNLSENLAVVNTNTGGIIPVSNNPESMNIVDKPIIISESKVFTSYYNKSNRFRLNEIYISDCFAYMHNDIIKFNVNNGKWYFYDNKKWCLDYRNSIVERVKVWLLKLIKTPRVADEANQDFLKKMLNQSKINNLLKLASSNRSLVISSNDLDRNPSLINFNNGTLDLSTGRLQKHNPSNLLTKIINFDYDPIAICPEWEKFLSRVVGNDLEIIDYIQKACGYSISGTVSEEIFFYVFGEGGNGKSIFFNILMEIFSDFVIKTPTEMLLQKSYEGISNDIVRMKGSRMVIAAEMPENRNLNEAKLKDLTGGDKITGRQLYQEYIEFKPTHSLWLYGNSKPKIVGTDNGIWRRLVIIPFNVTIPEDERIPRHILQEQLLSNRQGIFNWIIEGLEKYRAEGLKMPAKLQQEMNDYRYSLDVIARFINDCCIVDPLAECMGSDLGQVYNDWCRNQGESFTGKRKLYEKLSYKGFQKFSKRQGHYIFFKGLMIKKGFDCD